MRAVVICLKISIFALALTTENQKYYQVKKL